MINFYDEIIKTLEKNNKAINDIVWIGTRKYKVEKDKFLEDVKNLKYDKGYGIATINMDLIIAGKDWYLERWEYDGSEGFSYVPFLTEPQEEKEYSRKFIIPDTFLRDYKWLKAKKENK